MKIILLLIFLCPVVMASPGTTGVGIALGNPTGLSAKHWLSKQQAVDGAAGWSFGKKTEFSMHSDFLLHNHGAFFFNDDYPLDLYYGIGGRLEFSDEIELGLRVPVGLAHEFSEQKADIFAEVAPIMNLISETGFELHLLIGARYYFQ